MKGGAIELYTRDSFGNLDYQVFEVVLVPSFEVLLFPRDFTRFHAKIFVFQDGGVILQQSVVGIPRHVLGDCVNIYQIIVLHSHTLFATRIRVD